jgi:NAD+ synthase (glutamine-hydrolysing)
MKKIKLATAQFAVSADIQKNFNEICLLSRKAANKGAAIVIFPECALTGYPGGDMQDLSHLKAGDVRNVLGQIGALAKKLGMHIGVGTALPCRGRPAWTNSIVVYSHRGKRVCTYSKTALTGSDKRVFRVGKRDPVFKIKGIKFGCQICFDIRFAEGYRRLFKKGVQVVLHAYHQAGTKIYKQRREIMKSFARVRASENGIYSVSSNTIGRHRGRDQWISSMIVNPLGSIVKSLKPSQTGVAVATVCPARVFQSIELEIRRECARQLKIKVPGRRFL